MSNEEVSGPPLFGFDQNAKTLYLKQIPVRISRQDLLTELKNTLGFAALSMSDPLKA